MRAFALACCLAVLPSFAVAVGVVPAESPPPAPSARFDGRNDAAFAASVSALESDMGDAAKLGFHMKLAQVRAKLAEQRGRPLTDAEFAAALDGKTLADLDTLADAAPTHITIDIESSDDT